MKVCLLIIYNHNYESNIKVLDRIYDGRFKHVYHVMPFYRGDDPHVIGVYESSYQFSGYITQAFDRLKKNGFSHYVIVADDMVLNPELNESNITREFLQGSADAFISNYSIIDDARFMSWCSAIPSVLALMSEGNACEWRKFAPTVEEARLLFDAHGCDWRRGVSARLYRVVRRCCRVMGRTHFRYALIPPAGLLRSFYNLFSERNKIYPLVDGYSDIVVIAGERMDDFCHLCGVFAAARVFVEIAIPTALLLCCKKIRTLQHLGRHAENGIDDYRTRARVEQEFGLSYSKLISAFPKDYLYIHPVKLSKWKDLP